MSYSTNPVFDEIRHQEASEWVEKMQAHREKVMYDETMQLVVEGDFTRIYEAMDYDNNDKVVFEALRTCAASGSLAAARAIRHLAKTYARLFAQSE